MNYEAQAVTAFNTIIAVAVFAAVVILVIWVLTAIARGRG